MNDDSAPVTHAQLKGSLDALRSELREDMHVLRSELHEDMHALRSELREDMRKMHDVLSRELARHVTASAEQTQRLIVGLDDRYRDLPGRVTALERELDEHRRDTALHPRRRR